MLKLLHYSFPFPTLYLPSTDLSGARTDSPVDYTATEAEDTGQDVVVLLQHVEELQLNQQYEHVEREAQSALESVPFSPDPATREQSPTPTLPPGSGETTHLLDTTSPMELLQPFDQMENYSQTATTTAAAATATATTTTPLPASDTTTDDARLPLWSTVLWPDANNVTDSDRNASLNEALLEQSLEFPEPSYEPHRHYQPMPEVNLEEHQSQFSDGSKHYQPMPEANLDTDALEGNESSTESNQSLEEDTSDVTSATLDPVLSLKLEETRLDQTTDKLQVSLSTRPLAEAEGRVFETVASTESPTRGLNSISFPAEGSAEDSQGTFFVEEFTEV